jgi:hypothetical protein
VRSSHGSPHRGSGHRNCAVEVEEGVVGSVSPRVATVEVAGIGRNGQEAAAANQIARVVDGSEKKRRGTSGGWAGSVVRPRPEPGCLSRARWAGLASRPVGPKGLLAI